MSVWFEGQSEIACDLAHVKDAIQDLGEHYVGVISLMPGLTSVELVEQGDEHVTIKTNEGLMKRTNIAKRIEPGRVVVEFDEEYQAGSLVTAKTHFVDEFTASDSGIIHHTVMSDVEAGGIVGFVYRKFSSSSIGKAFLESYKTYFESL